MVRLYLSLRDGLTHMITPSNIVIKNWLVNPTGHKNAFVPVYLLQEHNNFWIKVFSTTTAILSAINGWIDGISSAGKRCIMGVA